MKHYALRIMLIAAALPAFAQSEYGTPRFMQGPMAGPAEPDAIRVWGRTSGAFPVQIQYSEHRDMRDARLSDAVTARKADDYTVVVEINGLEPDTTYYYQPYFMGEPSFYSRERPPFHTKTAPAGPSRFRIAFGSCARMDDDPHQPIWDVVRRLEPDAFFWVGDNVYGDTLDPQIIAEEYRHQRMVPDLEAILSEVPQYAVWDDHDYGLNDHDRRNPIKDGALRVFKQYWPNPSAGLPDTPGVFFNHTYGGVDFFFLDNRYYRDPNAAPASPDKTMLGEAQMEWLKDGLKNSAAPFKALVCGSTWNTSYGPEGDAWSAFRHERDALFDFIRDEDIRGVVLLAGDTHWGELNCIPWSDHGGYDLYEFVSSPLAQHTWPTAYQYVPEIRIRPIVTEGANVGIIDFDLTTEPATVTYSIYTHYGTSAWHSLTLTTDDLKNGVSTWQDKITDAAEKANTWGQAGKAATEE